MKKRALSFLFFLFIFQIGFSQWNDSIYLNTTFPSFFVADFKDVNFISEDSGIYSYFHYFSPSTGTEIWLKSTTDSGNTWNTVSDNTQQGTSSEAIHTVKDQNTFYHIRNWQGVTRIDKTNNNGVTWSNSPLGVLGWYNDFSAIDTSHLYLLYNDYSQQSFIGKYKNGIVSSKIDSFPNEQAHLMFFPTIDTGYVATSFSQTTNNHFIYKSIMEGTNWNQVFSDTLMNINKMFFSSANIGFVIGDSGKIVKTIDGGTNWQYLTTNSTLNLNGIFFLNDTIGYVVGDSGLILNTNDGGVNWAQQTVNTTTDFSKVFFVNDSIGFALTGKILYKTNRTHFEINDNKSSEFLVYPNPNNGIFSIKSKNIILNIEIINLLGKKVYSSLVNSNKAEIHLTNQSRGVYFINLIQENKNILTQKLIITN